MDKKRLKLENDILDRIKGKSEFLQAPKAKLKIILKAFQDFCKDKSYKGSDCRIKYFKDKRSKDGFFKGLLCYGLIEPLLDDPLVEDIIINGTAPIYVHHSVEGLKQTDERFESLEELELLIKKLLVFSGKTEFKKINNIDLLGMRGRVNIVYSPFGPEITIAKIKTNPLSIIDLIENSVLKKEMAALLWLYIEGMGVKPANILISGGPGSGKTTLLNALLSFIPQDQHLVVIEDTFELVTDWIGNVSRLESDDNLSLADLVKNSLRMRPERIIIGEVRGAETIDMMTAMNIGKYCLATIHASSVRDTITRLQSSPMGVPENLVNLIDVFVVMKKQKNSKQVARIMDELAETSGLEQKIVLISPLWRFDTATNSFNKLSTTIVYRDKLAKATGLTGKQILEEIEKRKDFLEALRQKKVRSVKDVSFYCELYAKDFKQAVVKLKDYPAAL